MLAGHIHPTIPLPLLLESLVMGLGVTALLEWNRRYIPREEPPEPPLPADALDARSYREVRLDWTTLAGGLILCAMSLTWAVVDVLCWLEGEPWAMQSVLEALLACLGSAFVISLSVTTLNATSQMLSFRTGLIRIQLPSLDIECCTPGFCDGERKPRGVKRTTVCRRGDRCIDITMKNGRVYRFEALRPTHICQLMEPTKKADL